MSQCPHCALSKISQQILQITPTNKLTQSFYQVFIDWFDLKEGWNSYQADKAVVCWVMVVICEATGIAITYFTQSAKEDENLSLLQDFVTWLAFWYNLEVKVISSDNEMNCIKIKEWCNNVGISLQSFAPDTHAQNGGTERFGRLIMEKTRAIRLSANLPHKLWKKIIVAAIYLCNQTPKHQTTGCHLIKPFLPMFSKRKKSLALTNLVFIT